MKIFICVIAAAFGISACSDSNDSVEKDPNKIQAQNDWDEAGSNMQKVACEAYNDLDEQEINDMLGENPDPLEKAKQEILEENC